MLAQPFVDYYELIECSPNASMATIERLFRHLAKAYHPDVAEQGDAKKFATFVEVFHVLKDPTRRAEYDKLYQIQKEKSQAVQKSESATMSDTDERTKILSCLYTHRRNNMKLPGLSQFKIAEKTDCPESAVEFHMWYFMQKGWVQREESGVLSITALGIDRIDEVNMMLSQDGRRRIEA